MISTSARFKKLMYVLTATITLLLISIAIYSYGYSSKIIASNVTNVIGGKIDIRDFSIKDNTPLQLNGDYGYYPGIYLDGHSVDYSLLAGEETRDLPLVSLNTARGTATYKLEIRGIKDGRDTKRVVLSIPFINEDVHVYMNGHLLERYDIENLWSTYSSESSIFNLLEYYDDQKEYQEILISTNKNETSTDLYKRQISISCVENILAVEKTDYVVQASLVGMAIMIVITGAMYVVITPTYSTLTFINLLDSTLLLHLLFNISRIPKGVMNTMYPGSFGDVLYRRLDLGLLFLGGYIGIILTDLIFDPEKDGPKVFRDFNARAYLVMGAILFVFPHWVNQYTIGLAIIILLFSLVGIVTKFKICYDNHEVGAYRWFHFIKALLFGVLVFYDMFTLDKSYRSGSILVVGYALFFFAHLFTRVYEYRLPFNELNKVNGELEQTIESRTKALVETNEMLLDLSIKDTLTKTFNRLYFDEQILTMINHLNCQEGVRSLHLCIFDLDDFKHINDNFGHDSGDQELQDVVKIVGENINDDIIFSRIGGEEFTLLFVDYHDLDVLDIIETIRHEIELHATSPDHTTASFGIAKASFNITRKEFFKKADVCLYHVKTNGKNSIAYDFDDEPNIQMYVDEYFD